MTTSYIALGSNLGQRYDFLLAAFKALAAAPGVEISSYSRIYETTPIGGPSGQGAYLNAVVAIRTSLQARELLLLLQSIEEANGRLRAVHWGPRTLDLDLLLYGNELIDSLELTVPHPRLTIRNFVVVPLCDIAPELTIPGHLGTILEMKQKLGEEGLSLTDLSF